MKSRRTLKAAVGSRALPTGEPAITPEELAKLRDSLSEAQDTLAAFRRGEVDAVVVSGAEGDQVYTLVNAEQPYRIYVERMQEGAVTVSEDGVILFCNQRFADMLGLPLERVISSDLRGYVAVSVWAALQGASRQNGDVVKLEQTLARQSGPPLPVTLTASPLPVDGRTVICLIVTDLTAQQHHAELQVAKEVAENANLAKDAFLAVLSHELRTPLNPALMTVIALEQDRTLPDRIREDISCIRRNIELEARLIDNLLDATQISQGKLQLKPAPMSVNAIVRSALEICDGEIRSRELQVELACGALADRTFGDAVRIQQAVRNLISNAAKFTPPGGRIWVSTANLPEDWIEIEVRDSGIGFDSAFPARLFDAFEQGGKGIARSLGGVGLGLAITQSIVLAHGGSISAESSGTDHGAVFTVKLPLRSCPSDASGAVLPRVQLKVSSPPRILLVEDHRDTRIALESLLRRHRFVVSSAGSAEEALTLASHQAFDIVVSDIGLPGQSGLDLMKELRSRHNLRGIATSGFGQHEDLAASQAAGFEHHLIKPVKLAELKIMIQNIVTVTES